MPRQVTVPVGQGQLRAGQEGFQEVVISAAGFEVYVLAYSCVSGRCEISECFGWVKHRP